MPWLMRLARWVRHPPSPGRLALVFGVVAICLLLVGFEHVFGWPDWLTVNRLGQGTRLPR